MSPHASRHALVIVIKPTLATSQGFRVWGLGFGVYGLGFRVQGLKFELCESARTPSCWDVCVCVCVCVCV